MEKPISVYFAMSELDIEKNEVTEITHTDLCGSKRDVLKQLIDQLNEMDTGAGRLIEAMRDGSAE